MGLEGFKFHCRFCEAEMKDGTNDHDILIKLSSDVDWLKKQFSNHLLHHQRLAYVLVGVACSSVGSLVVGIILLLLNR
jgi:hypothetical protein